MKLIKLTLAVILGLIIILALFHSGIEIPFFEKTKQKQQTHVLPEKVDEEFYEKNWYKSTFPTTMASVKYHTKKHGKGRSPLRYTQDAIEFYNRNKQNGRKTKLYDGTPAIKINVGRAGGYWTYDGRIVTFWD